MKPVAAKNTPGSCYYRCFHKNRFFHLIVIRLFVFIISSWCCVCMGQQASGIFYHGSATGSQGDSSTKLLISSIQVSGNKKTKRYIIEREMRFKSGDSVAAAGLYEKLQQSQQLIYNTAIFTEVKVEPVFLSATEVSILVSVKEKWYIYPYPQFQLVDRNFNEWLNTYNADLERVVYGLNFTHYNLSGRRDQLKVGLSNGFSRNISFTYSAPYSNSVLTEGFSIDVGLTQYRDLIYQTSKNNLPLRYNNPGFARTSFFASASYLKRKGFYRKQIFSIGYSNLLVDDSITLSYNPGYFNLSKNQVGFPEASYSFQYSNTNNINYPLTGKVYSLALSKRGFGLKGGINLLSLDVAWTKYLAHAKSWYSSIQAMAKVKAPFNLAYINQRAMGYGDFYLRGLENYVVDGLAAFLIQNTLKKKVVSFSIPVPFKNRIAAAVPFTIYAKAYADAGYSVSKAANDTRLGNRLLYTGGAGLDILTLYDFNFRIEYSFNQLGQKGLFLHAKSGF
jgi:outer membrane protein assembly factor BamA